MTGERWTAAPAYEAFMGRWSRLVARAFVPWLEAPPAAVWLDVGCGTGALTQAVVELAAPARVVGVDPSEGFLAAARAHVADPVAQFQVGSAEALPLPDASVDLVVSGLALNFWPDAVASVAEFVRVAREGAVVSAYVWDYAEGMGMLRHFWDAATALDEAALDPDEGARFQVCRPEPLRRLWTDAGLADVSVEALDVATVFEGFHDYWDPFLGGQGPAGSYVLSLSPSRQGDLRALLQARLPTGPDGSIPLTARAWAVRGRRWFRAEPGP